jgi:hypothetical protein
MFSLGHSFTEAQQVCDNHFDLAMRSETHHNITKIQLDSQEGRGAPWEQRSMLNGKKKKKKKAKSLWDLAWKRRSYPGYGRLTLPPAKIQRRHGQGTLVPLLQPGMRHL